MTKTKYLTRFSHIAKWRLSYQEADEVIEDYEGFFAQSSRSEHEVCLELGSPAAAVSTLGGHISYGYWLIAFSIQAISLLVPFFILLVKRPPLSLFISQPVINPYAIQALVGSGFLTSLFFFRPRKNFTDKKLPKTIIFSLEALFFVAITLGVLTTVFFVKLYSTDTFPAYSPQLPFMFSLSGTVFMTAGMWALVKSRMCDRRWRAVYILALTLLFICLSILDVLTCLDFTMKERAFHILMQELKFDAVFGGLGLLACGGSLC